MSDADIKRYVTPRAYFELKDGRYVHEALSSLGAIGCYLSHLKAWQVCVDLDRPLAVFEDDFRATPNARDGISTALKNAEKVDYDILRFCHQPNIDYGESLEKIDGVDDLYRITRTQGTTGYIITPKACRLLLSTALPIDAQLDHYIDMASLYHGLRNVAPRDSYYADPAVPSVIDHGGLRSYNRLSINTLCRHDKCICIMVALVLLVVVVVVSKEN